MAVFRVEKVFADLLKHKAHEGARCGVQQMVYDEQTCFGNCNRRAGGIIYYRPAYGRCRLNG